MLRNSRLLFHKLPVPGRNRHFKEITLSVIAPLLVSVLYAYCLYIRQCSCQQMPRTLCCGGSREQTSSWRRWNKGTSSENAGRKSAIMKKPGRRLRMMRKRWVWSRWVFMFLHELEHDFLSVIPLRGISSRQEVSIIDRKGSVGTHFLRMVNYASFRLRMFELCACGRLHCLYKISEQW